MTNEQAIDLLDNLIGFVEDNQNNDYDGALKMAIEALSAQKEWNCVLTTWGDCSYNETGCSECQIKAKITTALSCSEEPNRSDLISRQYVIGLIRSMYPSPPILPSNRRKWEEKYEQFIRAEREISRLPSAQPEIIRCKDCKDKRIYKFPPTYDEKHYCERHEKVTELDNYCSWAERKDNG